MNAIITVLLFTISAFYMNLMLQCGLGIKGTDESKKCKKISTLIGLGIIFFSVNILWILFSKIFIHISAGLFIYILVFPVSYMVYEAFHLLFIRFIIKKDIGKESFVCFPGGITAVSVFLCLNISNSFFQTFIISLGFVLGIMLIVLILREIRRQAFLEIIPAFLRGNPMILISMGLLSLVFSVSCTLVLRMIGIR